MADSVNAIKTRLVGDENKSSYLNGLDKTPPRQPRATNVDRSGNRLELTNSDGVTTHYQRK